MKWSKGEADEHLNRGAGGSANGWAMWSVLGISGASVYAGSAQFAMIGLFAQQAPVLVITLTVFLLSGIFCSVYMHQLFFVSLA